MERDGDTDRFRVRVREGHRAGGEGALEGVGLTSSNQFTGTSI